MNYAQFRRNRLMKWGKFVMVLIASLLFWVGLFKIIFEVV
jgi:uncharacterized membrane protein